MGTRGARGRLAVAVVAVALLVGACGEAGPPDRAAPDVPLATPTSLEDLPEGEPAAYPWLADGVLHVGSAAVPTEADRVVFRGGTTLVGRADEHRSTWWLLDDGRLEPLIDGKAAYLSPVLSADGGTAAWRVEVAATKVDAFTRHYLWDVVVFDVPSRSILGLTMLVGDVTCCDQGGILQVTGVTNDGRVSLSGGPAGGLSIWRAGDPVVPAHVRAAAYTGGDSWPLGVSYVRLDDSGDRVRYGRVDSRGSVTEIGSTSPTALWSADGRHVVDRVFERSTQSSRIEVSVPVTGATVVLALPPAPDWQVLAWEDDTHVLVARVRTPDAGPATYVAVVRCEVDRGACERISLAGRPG